MVADKRKPIILLAALCCMGALLVVFACMAWIAGHTDARPAGGVVAEIDGEPLSEEEFRWALSKERSSVIDQYKRTHGAVVDESFWQREYDGETPLDVLKRRALDSAVRMRVQLRLAERYGFMAEASYEGMMLELQRENARRKEALAAGIPVYGPTRFEVDDFADFYLGRLSIQLMDKLAGQELAATDERLIQHYEDMKDELFRMEGETRFYAMSAFYRKDGLETPESKREAAAVLEDIRERLAADEAADEIAEELGQGLLLQATVESFDEASARYYYRALPSLYDLLADDPEPGLVGSVIDDEANGRYMLAVVIDSKSGGYASYEEREDVVRQHYLSSQYNEYVSRLVNEARVVTLDEAYDQITVEKRRG